MGADRDEDKRQTRQSRAAARIQAAARGFVARRRFQRLRRAARTLRHYVRRRRSVLAARAAKNGARIDNATGAPAGLAEELFWNAVLTACWYCFSIGLVFFNKFVNGKEHGNFPAPMALTALQFALQLCIVTAVLSLPSMASLRAKGGTWTFHMTRVFPPGAATGLDIGLSNLSMRYITVSFHTMCKSSAPVFLVFFAMVLGVETPSLKTAGTVMVLSLGVLLTVAGETKFDETGFALVMTASALGGMRWVLTQILLSSSEQGLDNPFATLQYMLPVMTVSLGTVSLIVERPWATVPGSEHFFDSSAHASRTVCLVLISAVMAFFMTSVEFKLIKNTSAVMFSVLGIVKEVLTISLGSYAMGDEMTAANIAGLVLVVVGIGLFNLHKLSQRKERAAGEQKRIRDSGRRSSEGDVELAMPQSFAPGVEEEAEGLLRG